MFVPRLRVIVMVLVSYGRTGANLANICPLKTLCHKRANPNRLQKKASRITTEEVVEGEQGKVGSGIGKHPGARALDL